MTREDFEEDSEALVLDPECYDEALIGKDLNGLAVYSVEKVIQVGIDHLGMKGWDESSDYHYFNTFGAIMENGPIFVYTEEN